MKNPLFSDEHKQAFNIAIHDIKQRHDWDINNLILINKDNYDPVEQEPITGHWIEYSWNDNGLARWGLECDKCHKKYKYGGEIWNNPNFCPNCGAKMESGNKE